jgi:CheY-like chemotaxis protein
MVERQRNSSSVLEEITTGLGNGTLSLLPLACVLIIDDETMVAGVLSAMLRADGYEVVTAQSGKAAVDRMQRQHFDLAITDVVMPGMGGIQTLAALKGIDPEIEVIVLTGHASIGSAVGALKQGACDYLLKPINVFELRAAVARALERRWLNTALSSFGAGPALLATLDRQDLIPAVLELAQRTLRATGVGLALLGPKNTELCVEISECDGQFGEASVRNLAEQAIRAREALRDPASPAYRSPGEEAGWQEGSVLAYPLEVRGTLLGALVLWREKCVTPFTAFELRGGKILAAEIAITLDNTRLRRELSRKVEELETTRSAMARAEARARTIIDAVSGMVSPDLLAEVRRIELESR